MAKQAKSVDDLFTSEAPSEPVDVSSLFSPPSGNKEKYPELKGGGRALGEMMMSVPIGAAQGATLGYSDRVLPQSAQDMANRNPISKFIGNIAGGIAPGMGIAKGVGTLGKLSPYLSALSKPGFLSGAAEGGTAGLIMDPGENGSRTNNAKMGAGFGGSLGLISKLLKGAGNDAAAYDAINSPKENYATKVKGDIESSIESLMAKEVAPRQNKIRVLLNDKKIDLNPDLLRGFKRDALTGPARQKGGLDTLANILERKQAESGNRAVPGNTAQKIKQYLDQVSDYAKQKPYSETASARNDRAKYGADVLRGKLRDTSPEYDSLNEPMSNALGIKNTIRASSDTSPMSIVSSDPMTDRGQLVQELDRLSGSSLGETGKTIRDAKGLRAESLSLLRPLESTAALFKYGKLGVGRTSNAADKVLPTGTRQSVLNSILQQLKPQESESDE